MNNKTLSRLKQIREYFKQYEAEEIDDPEDLLSEEKPPRMAKDGLKP